MTVFVEDWGISYGSPYLIEPDDRTDEPAELVEDGKKLRFHAGRDFGEPLPPLAFVDGVRRGEASLYEHDAVSGEIIRGVTGAHACGAVLKKGAERMEFHDTRVTRLVIWGAGQKLFLPQTTSGFRWESDTIEATAPDAPLRRLQDRMRSAEAALAESIGKQGYLTVIDGPLPYGRVIDAPIIGYIKTHHKALLPPRDHTRVPDLAPFERTSLFVRKEHCYSCYLRLAPKGPFSGPWAGIVRLEVPIGVGREAAAHEATRAAFFLPRFAGIPHKDPRAPQNLQPIGALENHLRHLLGDARLAGRAVRESVSQGRAARALSPFREARS